MKAFSRWWSHIGQKRVQLGVFTLLFVAAGATLILTKAATPVASIEPDAGTISAPATKQTSVAASAASFIKFGNGVTSGADCIQAIVPAYFYPGTYWNQATNGARKPAIMIMDVDGIGAGSSRDTNYVSAVQAAQAQGIKIYGYVDTAYASRPQSQIQTELANYKNWYNVTDIFLDQVNADSAGVNYYQSAVNLIHTTNTGSSVILNHGTDPIEAYANIGDILSTYETDVSGYSSYQPASWMSKYPASKFYNIIYNVSGTTAMNQVINAAKTKHVGYLYVTNDVLVNPYDILPSYWSAELDALAVTCN